MTVDTQVFDPGTSHFTSLMRLATGKARALVSKVYGTAGASYEIRPRPRSPACAAPPS
jgi:hypothetical protein